MTRLTEYIDNTEVITGNIDRLPRQNYEMVKKSNSLLEVVDTKRRRRSAKIEIFMTIYL